MDTCAPPLRPQSQITWLHIAVGCRWTDTCLIACCSRDADACLCAHIGMREGQTGAVKACRWDPPQAARGRPTMEACACRTGYFRGLPDSDLREGRAAWSRHKNCCQYCVCSVHSHCFLLFLLFLFDFLRHTVLIKLVACVHFVLDLLPVPCKVWNSISFVNGL